MLDSKSPYLFIEASRPPPHGVASRKYVILFKKFEFDYIYELVILRA